MTADIELQCRSTDYGFAHLIFHRNLYLQLAREDEHLAPQRSLAAELRLRLSIVGVSLLLMLLVFLPIALSTGIGSSTAAGVVAAVVVAVALLVMLVHIPVRTNKTRKQAK